MAKKPEMIECKHCRGFGGFFAFVVPTIGVQRVCGDDDHPKNSDWRTCSSCHGAGFVKKAVDKTNRLHVPI